MVNQNEKSRNREQPTKKVYIVNISWRMKETALNILIFLIICYRQVEIDELFTTIEFPSNSRALVSPFIQRIALPSQSDIW